MKQLNFPGQTYNLVKEILIYERKEDSIVGLLELLYQSIYLSEYKELDRLKAKIVKKLLKKLREVTRYKDKDQNSRVANEGPQVLILEDSEFDLMKTIYGKLQFSPMAAEDVDALWEVIESAQDYIPPKPALVKE